DWATVLRMDVLHLDNGFLLAILPPGAFIGLGLLVATKNWLDNKFVAKVVPAPKTEVTRARVTSL
ncbi:MAG: electron transport complex subunit RsxE, partial [Candidatus Oceanisphaera merdipullorum]|nr:electron transport complex subunit RsxE [Candidatus Oceanisphaera merdipullorum]